MSHSGYFKLSIPLAYSFCFCNCTASEFDLWQNKAIFMHGGMYTVYCCVKIVQLIKKGKASNFLMYMQTVFVCLHGYRPINGLIIELLIELPNQNLASSLAYSPSSAIPEARSADRCAAAALTEAGRKAQLAPLTEKYSGHDLTGFLL